nr:DUF3703 domain-containing protein [uncultured Noviherbaspirillum sp.]
MPPVLMELFEREMAEARSLYRDGLLDQAFSHLENAHVLGQRFVAPHVRSHWFMLRIGLRRRSASEACGQAVRIVLGALGSALGLVPTGNTGGTNVGMFRRLPVRPDIAHLLAQAAVEQAPGP